MGLILPAPTLLPTKITPEQIDIMARCSDPGADPKTLHRYGHLYPSLVLANPQLPLIQLEDQEMYDTIVMVSLEGLAMEHMDAYLDRALSKGSAQYPWISFAWLTHQIVMNAFELIGDADLAAATMSNIAGKASEAINNHTMGEAAARIGLHNCLEELAQVVGHESSVGVEAHKLLLLCRVTNQRPPELFETYAHEEITDMEVTHFDSDEDVSDD